MSDSIPTDLTVVLCDMCTGEDRKPAKKTCMKCEISMCVQHLQVHLTTPVLLQTHPLTEPMASCGTSKCPLHGKLLEYYCLDDLTCVCVSCAIEDQHRLHNMKTFPTAHKELTEKISAEQQALLVKTDDDNVSLEKWEKREREKLGRCSVRLMEAVSSLRDMALTSVQSSVSARMVSIKTSKSSMQAAQGEKDTFRFLQMYSQVHEDVEKAKAADLRKGLEPGSDRDKLVKELREGGEKMVEQADQFWCSLLTHVDPENQQKLFDTNPDLVFEPKSWTSSMSLSQDMRKVFYSSWLGQCNATLLIQGIQAVADVHRFMVSLSGDCDWTLGICSKASAEKNFSTGPIYGLSCKDDNVRLVQTAGGIPHMFGSRCMPMLLTQGGPPLGMAVPRPEVVEVCWSDSSLAFYSRPGQHKRDEITTVEVHLHGDLVPFIQLGGTIKSQNISTTSASSLFGSQQIQWTCSCGEVYTVTINGYKRPRDQDPTLPDSTCSCGAPLDSHRTTMRLCELL